MNIRSRSILVIILYVFMIGCDTENNLDPRFEDYFIKYHGGTGDQVGVDFQIIEDGFLLLGNSVSSTLSKSQVFLVRTDLLGNEIWRREYGGVKNEFATAIEVDQTGNIYMSVTIETDPGNRDVKILKVNSTTGAPLDSVVVGAAGFDEVSTDILIVDDGDIILSGYTNNVDTSKPGFNALTDLEDIFSIRTTPDLDTLSSAEWRRVSGFPGVDRGTEIVQQPDGTFLFFGTTDRRSSDTLRQRGLNMFLFPTNRNGVANSSIEFQFFGSLSNESGVQIVPTFGNGYAMIGTTSNGPGDSEGYIVRVRSNSNLLEEEVIERGRLFTSSSIIEDVNGGFLVLGSEFEGANSDILLLKRSLDGQILWERSFGGIDEDLSAKVKQTDDGSIIILGTVRLESQTKMALIKTNPNGELTP